jgi:hypothetical protein
MAFDIAFTQQVRITETVVDDFTDEAADTFRKELEQVLSLDDASTPDIEDYAIFTVTMTAGAATVNLAALAHIHGGATITKNATGKKVRLLGFLTPLANTGNVTIAKGASNGYAPLGSTYERILAPDTMESQYFKAAATDVASGARTLDVSGTGSETVKMVVAWG